VKRKVAENPVIFCLNFKTAKRHFGDVPRTLHHAGFTLRESIEPEVIFLLRLRTGQPEFQSHRHPSPTKAL
jgi:hypothetical protein